MHRRILIQLCCLLAISAPVLSAVPVGSVALYSDGKVEKLLANENGLLTWEDDRKRIYVRSGNPILPVLERRDFLSGKSYRQTLNSGEPDAILTRPPGTRVEFSVMRLKNTGENSKRTWECVLEGRAQKKVAGAMRELDRYKCDRYVYHRKLWNRMFRETKTFSYSQELGLVVDQKRKTRKTTSRSKLVAVIPPEGANYRRLSKKVRKVRAPEKATPPGKPQ